MTRNEFIRDYQNASIEDLVDFCYENDFDYTVEDYYREDGFNDYVYDVIIEDIRDNGWREGVEYAESLPGSGYDWYIYCDGDWVGVDDNEQPYQRGLFEDILSVCDDSDFWDYDEDENENPIVDITTPYNPTDEELSFYQCSEEYESVLLQ